MRKTTTILILAAMFAATGVQAQRFDYQDMATFGQYLQQHRQTYSAYAREKADLLKLSDSRDPAQINAEFQGKLNAITSAYQDIYHSKVAAFNAGVGVAVGSLSSEWQELGGMLGGMAADLFAGSAKRSAEEEAARERARLTLEFEDKFFTLREEVLIEKRKMTDFYLMAAAFQLSESEEKKYLDLANYLDCECQYIEDNFSLASVSWLGSNCPRPATTKYAVVAAPKEPTAEELLAIIEHKLSIQNVHFIRAARDFADIGMAKFPKNSDFLFYRAYLSEDPNAFNLMLIDELLKLDPKNEKALTLKKYIEEYPKDVAKELEHTKKLSVGVPGNPRYILTKGQLIARGYVYPVVRNGKMIYVAPDGERAFDGEYEFACIFSGNYARVMKDGKWGMIDKAENVFIPCVYAELGDSFDRYGYINVGKITGKYGIFSINGQWIIEPEEDYRPVVLSKNRFLRFDNILPPFFDKKGGLYDENGTKLSNDENIGYAKFHYAIIVVDGWFKVPVEYNGISKVPKKWTFMDTDGKYVWGKNVCFDKIIDAYFKDGKCKVSNGKDTFYIDKTGKRID